MKIYTKTGDKGQTSLIGGTRVPKYHTRIEAYGTVDELNSHIGLLRSHPLLPEDLDALVKIQDRLFTMGANLAADPVKARMKLPQIFESDVQWLETEIDRMNLDLAEMRSFVLPGGSPLVSFCHIARCVCRRAERAVVKLGEEEKVDDLLRIYLNRLSDYLFVLSRKFSKDAKITELPWVARM